jgi:hypothetical protein
MASITFDTLKFAQTLREKGKLTSEQAEGISQAFADASNEQMVTKSDLKDELAPIKSDLNLLKWMLGFVLAFLVALFFLSVKR